MEKKKKIRFIVVWLLITAAFLAGRTASACSG